MSLSSVLSIASYVIMKRSATGEVDTIREELIDQLLGKVFVADDTCTTSPRFCQVLGWSKNAEKANAKVRYIYAKEISTLALKPAREPSFPTPIRSKAMINVKEVEKKTEVRQPIHSLDKKRPEIFQCILRRNIDEEDEEYRYSLDRRCVSNKVTCAVIEIGARYWMQEWETLRDKVFLCYDD